MAVTFSPMISGYTIAPYLLSQATPIIAVLPGGPPQLVTLRSRWNRPIVTGPSRSVMYYNKSVVQRFYCKA